MTASISRSINSRQKRSGMASAGVAASRHRRIGKISSTAENQRQQQHVAISASSVAYQRCIVISIENSGSVAACGGGKAAWHQRRRIERRHGSAREASIRHQQRNKRMASGEKIVKRIDGSILGGRCYLSWQRQQKVASISTVWRGGSKRRMAANRRYRTM